MGLDMYLSTNSKRCKRDAERAEPDERRRSYFHKDDVAIRWHKANHIHKWFVDNVQDGEDDCGAYDVDVEQLKELRDTCDEVLASSHLVLRPVDVVTWENGKRVVKNEMRLVLEDASVAKKLLPVSDGFFFGEQSYGEWYVKDTRMTSDMLGALLENVVRDAESEFDWHWVHKDEPDWHVRFTYSSSW